jgi:stage III sporulation protein AH
MVEDYMKVLTNPDASDRELKEANSKIQQLMKVDNQETVLEDLIRKQGYNDAVVVANNPHVDVVVQSNKLTPKQVVKLISLVRQHLNVSPQHISIAYRQ